MSHLRPVPDSSDDTDIPIPWGAPDSTDVGFRAHQAAVAHLERCYDAMDAEEDGEDVPEDFEMAAPFDGCVECISREVLFAAWPVLFPQESPQPEVEGDILPFDEAP